MHCSFSDPRALLETVKFILKTAVCLRVETCWAQTHFHINQVATGSRVLLAEEGSFHLNDAFVFSLTQRHENLEFPL